MSRFQAEPEALLRPYVHCYWTVARDLSAMGGFTITPDRFLELIFFADPPWVEEAGERRRLPACTLIPLLDGPLRIAADGVVRCAAVRLHAWAAGLVFPAADASAPRWFDLTARFGDLVPAVQAALRREANREIAGLLDRTMRRALAGARPVPVALAAAREFASLPEEAAAAGPRKKAGAVAREQGRSRRQMERQVRALTHRSPKQLASLARFQFVRDTLWTHPRKELAALAFEAGYADQAHLTRHFRRYTGQTPGGFLRDCARLKAALRAQDAGGVAFLQDDSPAD